MLVNSAVAKEEKLKKQNRIVIRRKMYNCQTCVVAKYECQLLVMLKHMNVRRKIGMLEENMYTFKTCVVLKYEYQNVSDVEMLKENSECQKKIWILFRFVLLLVM